MTKPAEKSGPNPDDVLRRMLATPPKQHQPLKPAAKKRRPAKKATK